MRKEISPHAKTILALLNNAAELSVRHNEYRMAKDVIHAMKKLCKDLGFEIDNDVFEYIVECIGAKPPAAMKAEFDKFASMIKSLDRKMDKETATGKKIVDGK